MADNKPVHIAIFVSFSGQGGVERMIVNLCHGFVQLGCRVDLVLVKSRSAHLENLPASVRVIRFKKRHTLTSLFELAAYLRRERPLALLAAKDRAGRVAVVARKLAGVRTRLVFRIGTTVSAALEGKGWFRKLSWYLPMRLIYPHADAIVAVSEGVAEDLRKITGLSEDVVRVIRNPVITERLAGLAAEEPADPWLEASNIPLIIGVGRLTRQKDFASLLKAFARVRANRPCRLLILGEGRGRTKLEQLAMDLGVQEDVRMPGFVTNPYKYLSRAQLFVLSSAWEGSPNVLTEAMALGIPVVATDCPSGPREILQGGEYGPLVPVGDVEGLAAAMEQVLDCPPAPEMLRGAVGEYTVVQSSRHYLAVLTASN
jgi:glycosyltransferase involved in cell wall biosynthesis